jgi:hypothetical protein
MGLQLFELFGFEFDAYENAWSSGGSGMSWEGAAQEIAESDWLLF